MNFQQKIEEPSFQVATLGVDYQDKETVVVRKYLLEVSPS